MKFSILIMSILISALISSCSSSPYNHWHGPLQTIGLRDRTTLERSGNWALSKESKIYIVFAENELLDEGLHDNLAQTVKRYFPASMVGTMREGLAESLDTAVLNDQDFLLYPQVWEREDRTGWNVLLKKKAQVTDLQKSRLKVDIALYSIQPGLNARIAGNTSSLKSVDNIQFQSSGGIFTGTGDEMLWPTLDEYLRHLSQY